MLCMIVDKMFYTYVHSVKRFRQHSSITTTTLHLSGRVIAPHCLFNHNRLMHAFLPGTTLKNSHEIIRSKIQSSSCYLARNADAVRAFKYSENLGLACTIITSKTASITDSLIRARDPIRIYAVVIRKIVFYVSYAFISMLCLLLATFVALRLKVPTQATFFLTYVVVFLLTVVSCGIMITVVRTEH